MTMTIAKTKHESTIITSKSVSIGSRWSDADGPNQSNWSRNTDEIDREHEHRGDEANVGDPGHWRRFY